MTYCIKTPPSCLISPKTVNRTQYTTWQQRATFPQKCHWSFHCTRSVRSCIFFYRGNFLKKINHKILVKYYAIFSLDYDECQSNSSNNCEQICVNIPTSFFCECRDGYSLNEDGRSCDGKTFVFKLRKLYGKIRGEFLALSFNVELDQDNEIVVHFSFFRWRKHHTCQLNISYQIYAWNIKRKSLI